MHPERPDRWVQASPLCFSGCAILGCKHMPKLVVEDLEGLGDTAVRVQILEVGLLLGPIVEAVQGHVCDREVPDQRPRAAQVDERGQGKQRAERRRHREAQRHRDEPRERQEPAQERGGL
eukprot:CAMPEP_0171159186 /NCGR_PEP_ID=MMETSP0790-20130122/2908_1 /TAXON_ID=2925 /ORGANISM="Alexandrium catenella, Strain OF101" /LENGTH=119 /DNA_ID=CAMNT_0011623673 /DNA_START=123 /DNA_END=478 /DNA_ORIENTATION=+